MDTSAYLHRHGWLGTGHALHPTGRGLHKPLLVSHKQNVLGVGKKKHDSHADQWWARAFDSSLKGLNVSKEDGDGAGKEVGGEGVVEVTVRAQGGALDMVRRGGGKWVGKGGLYGCFVRGEGLRGTLREGEGVVVGVGEDLRIGRKRKDRDDDEERKERKRRRKERKRRRKERKLREVAEVVAVKDHESPDAKDSKVLKEAKRKKETSGEDAAAPVVTSTVVTVQASSPPPTRKKKRKDKANKDGASSEPVTSTDSCSVNATSTNFIPTGTPSNDLGEVGDGKAKTLAESLERRRRKAVRKALETKPTSPRQGQPHDRSETNATSHRKTKKRKHMEK